MAYEHTHEHIRSVASPPCPHCEELQAELDYLKSELGLQVERSSMDYLSKALAITPKTAATLMRLYSAYPKAVTRLTLERNSLEAHVEEWRECADNLVSQYALRIRKVLGRDSLVTLDGYGYRLTEAGAERVRAVLEGRG